MSEEGLTEDTLELVAERGNSHFTQAIALVELARRNEELDLLDEYVDGVDRLRGRD